MIFRPPSDSCPCWTDAHCHLQDPALAGEVDRCFERATVFGINRCVVNATREADWEAVASLAQRFPDRVLPQFGIHPWEADKAAEGWEDRLAERLLSMPRAGIGEIGLDSKLTDTPLESQRTVFAAQLDLAVRLNRPCTVHLVGAWAEFHDGMNDRDWPRMLLHSFNGSPEQVDAFSSRPVWFSFGGAVIRHANSDKLQHAVKRVPEDRLMLETDAPYQHPDGKRKTQEPAGLMRVAEAVACLRGIPVDALRRQCEENLETWLNGGG